MNNPSQIGRYLVERRLGKGGMAIIYLAHDPVVRRLVAIKLLPKTMAQDSSFIIRFQREVETLAALEHPAIVPIYDYGEHDGQPFYVMQYMSGGSLVDKLRKGTISLPETAKIIRQIAPALDAAHRKSIIHRDIKPGNILFDADDNAYLSDFGIVKIATSERELSGGSVMGTPTYMSPELARGEVDVDGRSDIYALGVLIFRMWAGVAPFTANNPMAIAMKHVIDPVPNILNFKPAMPSGCNLLIQKAMSKRRKDRFQYAANLSIALDELSNSGNWYIDDTLPTLTDIDEIPSEYLSKHNPNKKPFDRNTNLPTQSSTFIGRRAELSKIEDRLLNPDCHLLTLLGPGGIGKTRLALEAGSISFASFTQGVFLVPLASVPTNGLLLPAIADSIGFTFYESDRQKNQLLNYLRSKSLLLILDNYEHLIGEVTLISEILETAPDVKLLVTTRERLNLAEEWIIQVHGMDYPEGSIPPDFESYPSVQLFLDRAQKVKPNFRLTEADKPYIVRICQQLEGVPLGIELAAAWVRLLTLAEIASEIEQNLDFLTSSMRNTTPRHRSLRAIFNYSWELLDKEEQETFRQLSVFRGGFTRKAAANITGASLSKLRSLLDKSLLNTESGDRYVMQDVIRQYASEKLRLDVSRCEDINQKHCNYYADMLHNLGNELLGGRQKDTLNKLQTEFENIRASWEWSIRSLNITNLNLTYNALYRFLEFRGRLIEGDHIFNSLVESLEQAVEHNEEARLLQRCAEARHGAFLYRLGREEAAEFHLQNSIEYLRENNTPTELSFALTYLGAVYYLQNKFDKATAFLQESLSILEDHTDRLGKVIALHHLALISLRTEHFEQSRELFMQSLRVNQDIENPFGEAISLNNLGLVSLKLGDLNEAWSLHNQSLDIREEMEDRWGIGNSLDGLGLIAIQRGDLVGALYFFEESSEIYREVGDAHRLDTALANIAKVEAQLHQPDH